MIASYRFAGQDEYCLRIDRGRDTRILVIQPLFEEANRTRHMLAEMMRALDGHGIDSLMPDLPGRNESAFPQHQADLDLWRNALAECAEQLGPVTHIAALRGGALLIDCAPQLPVWRLAPAKGEQLLRTMIRARLTADREAGKHVTEEMLIEAAQTGPVELAGNLFGTAMIDGLKNARPEDVLDIRRNSRTVRNSSEPDFVTGMIDGKALWLRAEPEHNAVMSQAIADDIAEWIRS